MCEVCGCGDPHKVSIDVHASLLSDNDRQAHHLREHFVASGILALNVMGSPGSGKTALIEATSRALANLGAGAPRLRLAAVSGDLATSLDAERLALAGVPSTTITTGSACHLDAAMVHHALHDGALAAAVESCDVFFIENVGNLVCPAIYDLGQHANVVVLSVTEGVDKPLKYPVMFRKADLVVLTKIDLLPHLPGVSLAAIRENLARVMPSARAIEVSATSGAGVDDFVRWLGERRAPLSRS
ncbi:N/A [soil metagenome]